MKLAQLYKPDSSSFELALVQNNLAFFASDLQLATTTLQQLITAGSDALTAAAQQLATAKPEHGRPVQQLRHAPAVSDPPVTLAVGLNYSDHASELKLDNDSGPVLFSLFPNSLAGHRETVELPVAQTTEVDYEGELGVIIGKTAKNVRESEALNYVFGYTVVNDLTARNIQFAEPQWSRCKSFDGFTPVGPVVVTADEIPDPQNLRITTDVDGLRVQDDTTAKMVRTVAQLIVSLSRSLTLLPGTLISTGSPGGAGRSRKPPLYLREGSVTTVTIEKIGALTTYATENYDGVTQATTA